MQLTNAQAHFIEQISSQLKAEFIILNIRKQHPQIADKSTGINLLPFPITLRRGSLLPAPTSIGGHAHFLTRYALDQCRNIAANYQIQAQKNITIYKIVRYKNISYFGMTIA